MDEKAWGLSEALKEGPGECVQLLWNKLPTQHLEGKGYNRLFNCVMSWVATEADFKYKMRVLHLFAWVQWTPMTPESSLMTKFLVKSTPEAAGCRQWERWAIKDQYLLEDRFFWKQVWGMIFLLWARELGILCALGLVLKPEDKMRSGDCRLLWKRTWWEGSLGRLLRCSAWASYSKLAHTSN